MMLIFVLLAFDRVSSASASPKESSLHRSTCAFLRDTDFADNVDVRRAIGKLLDDGKVDTLSFLLYSLHVAVSHLWCPIAQTPFDTKVTKAQQDLGALIKTHPIDFRVLTGDIRVATGEVMMPLVTAYLNHMTNQVDLHVSWLRKGTVDDVWVDLCHDGSCDSAAPVAEYDNPLFQGAALSAVPLNEVCQIYVQPDMGSPPSSHSWVGTVRFEIVESPQGKLSFLV
jgi:hypothetical protein